MKARLDIYKIVCPHCGKDSNRESGVELHDGNDTDISQDREHPVACMECNYEFVVRMKVRIEVSDR